MEYQICHESLKDLFDKLKVIYEQNDMTNFYISARNVKGYKVSIMSYNTTPRIYTVWNYAVEEDRLKIDDYQNKCFNCDMCTIVQDDGILNVYKQPIEIEVTKQNIANKFCIYFAEDPSKGIYKKMLLSASDDQYLYGHALLTTSDHIPNHYTFMYKEVYSTIFKILDDLYEQYPDVTAYFNGRLGSSVQHSHVHLSPDRSFVAKYCLTLSEAGSIHNIDYHGIKGCLVKIKKDLIQTDEVHQVMQSIVLKNIINNPDNKNALAAHMFLDNTYYYVFFMVLKNSSLRSCDVVIGGKHIQVNLITAVSTISLFNQTLSDADLESLLSRDITGDGSIPLYKCLEQFNTNYKPGGDIYQAVNSATEISALYSSQLAEAVKNLYDPISGNDDNAILAIAANIDKFWFQFFHDYAGSFRGETKVYRLLEQNTLLKDYRYTFALNIIASNRWGRSGRTEKHLLEAYTTILLQSFASKLGALQSGVCYALRGDYLQPRIKDTITTIVNANNVQANLASYPLIARGGFGAVYRSTNIFNRFPIPFYNFNANIIIKKQVYGTDVDEKARVETELENGKVINKLRTTLPNFMLTYGGYMGPTEGLLFVEDIQGETLHMYLASQKGMTFSWNGLYNITISLLSAIFMAKYKNGFTHYDLHTGNVLLLPMSKCGGSGNITLDYVVPTSPESRIRARLEYLPVIIDYGFVYVDGRPPFTDPGFPWFRDEFCWTSDIHQLLISILYFIDENHFQGPITPLESLFRDCWLFLFCIFSRQFDGKVCNQTQSQMPTYHVPFNRSAMLENYLGQYYREIQRARFSQPFHLPDPAFLGSLPSALQTMIKDGQKSQEVFINFFYWITYFETTYLGAALPASFNMLTITMETTLDTSVSKVKPGDVTRRFKKMLDDRDVDFPRGV